MHRLGVESGALADAVGGASWREHEQKSLQLVSVLHSKRVASEAESSANCEGDRKANYKQNGAANWSQPFSSEENTRVTGGWLPSLTLAFGVTTRMRNLLVLLILLSCFQGCRSNALDSAMLQPWGWESADHAKYALQQYKHVIVVRIDEDYSTGGGRYGLTAHNYRATVVRSYKGNWQHGDKIAFVHYVDALPSSMLPRNALSGEFKFVFTDEYTDSEIALDTGEFGAYHEPSMAPALETLYGGKSR